MLKKVLLHIIRFYQNWISPFLPHTCRYYPSCSHYGIQAIECHGGLKGFSLLIKRLLRCHPYSTGGVDSVPNTEKAPEPPR